MAIVRLSPFRDMMRLRNDMNRIFDEMVNERDVEGGVWLPLLDISETEDYIQVRVDVPGVEKDDIALSINNNVLVIRGEKKLEKESEGENFHRIERVYGNFYRSVELPVLVQADKIKATFKNGVLDIVLPKAEEIKPKEIPIELE